MWSMHLQSGGNLDAFRILCQRQQVGNDKRRNVKKQKRT
jgi:hypothetical protein